MTPIHKRVPHDMAKDYTRQGWKIWRREGRTVVLIWEKAGPPP